MTVVEGFKERCCSSCVSYDGECIVNIPPVKRGHFSNTFKIFFKGAHEDVGHERPQWGPRTLPVLAREVLESLERETEPQKYRALRKEATASQTNDHFEFEGLLTHSKN